MLCVCVCECEYVYVAAWLGRQVSWTTNVVCGPVSYQGLFTILVNTLTKIKPTQDPVPKPKTQQTSQLQTPQSIETDLTTKLHHWHTHTRVTHTPLTTTVCYGETNCVTLQQFLSPPLFVCHQSSIMKTVDLDRKPRILCYYCSTIITQEVSPSHHQLKGDRTTYKSKLV